MLFGLSIMVIFPFKTRKKYSFVGKLQSAIKNNILIYTNTWTRKLKTAVAE